MVAVGADLNRTCTCGLVKWDAANPCRVREVIGFDPARRDENDAEFIVHTRHYFDGTTPCARISS